MLKKTTLFIFLSLSLMLSSITPNDGLKWTHADLIKIFKDNGLVFEYEKADGNNNGPAMNFIFKDYVDGVIYVQIRKNEQDAKDEAGSDPENSFSWSRFYFYGTKDILSIMEDILNNKKVKIENKNVKITCKTTYGFGDAYLKKMIKEGKLTGTLEEEKKKLKYSDQSNFFKSFQIILNVDGTLIINTGNNLTDPVNYKIVNNVLIVYSDKKEGEIGVFKNNGKYLELNADGGLLEIVKVE